MLVGLTWATASRLCAQDPAAQQKNQPQQEKPAGAPQRPAGKPAEDKTAAPQGPKLETPLPTGSQKPAERRSEEKLAAPGNLQLETPQPAPAKPANPRPPEPVTPPQGPQPGKAPEAPASEEKQPPAIEDIIFRGNRRTPAATLRARILSHKGDAYDENALERDFMALWNTGFFDDIRLEVTDAENGRIVTFFVREKKIIRSIDPKGLSTVTWSDVLDEFKKRKVGLSIQSQYDPVVIKRAEVILQEMLAAHGREFATVRTRTRNIPPNSVALTFIVVEGPKVKLGNVRFQGNTVFSGYQLARSMKYSRPAGLPPWFYWFHKTYDRDRIQADLENIRDLYRSRGYFFALPKEPQTKMVDTRRRWPFFFYSWGRGKRVDAMIPVEEGAQYRLGKFVIRGNKLFKQEQLTPMLQLKTGDIFDLSRVRKTIENYTKLYGQFGYIDFTASPDIEPDNKRRIINLALDFDEQKQFFLHRIEFSGNTKTRDKVIRRELLVDEGYVFNSSLWDLSILRVNQLGFFEPLKKDDYEIRRNPKESSVDVIMKVKEKGRNSIGFSGGVSGLAGNFVGLNYATNNFLGLGETLSVSLQFGTFEKLYSFGFTEPYLFDRPITTGFTIFKSDYRYDQAREAAFFAGVSPSVIQQSPFGQFFFQNFQQNSSGFSVFATYPPKRMPFGRVGVTYSYSNSSLQTFSAASDAFFKSLAFRSLQGPDSLIGIRSSTIMPTFAYNTVDDAFNPHRGKYVYAALGFTGSFIGGNVNSIRPVLEAKYFHPVNHRRNVLGFHVLGSMVSGFGGKVAPPFSRFYTGGEDDIRGFDIRTISPIVFFPTTTSVCNRDNAGNVIPLLGSDGNVVRDASGNPQCGSSTKFPYNTVIFPGGDTEVITNFEYRIPLAGPVTLAYFVDLGTNFISRQSQLRIEPSVLQDIKNEFPFFQAPEQLRPVGVANFQPRSSTGLELQVILPVVNAPFRIFYGYNWLRLNTHLAPPLTSPPQSLFPNTATYNDALRFFAPLQLQERKARLGFTVARTF